MIRSQKQLTKELIDQIIFGMENQEHEFLLDLDQMVVLKDLEIDDFEATLDGPDLPRYLDIPQWQSLDGFHLMELFVHKLHNPLAKVELQRILQSGKGVFRQFKDLLHQYPEVAKRWYRFKDQHMHRLITEWFSTAMETYGIAFDAPEYEDTEELLLNDFDLYVGRLSDLQVQVPDNPWTQMLDQLIGLYGQEIQAGGSIQIELDHDQSIFGLLLTPSHDPVGLIWGWLPSKEQSTTQGNSLDQGPCQFTTGQFKGTRILVLYVVPEYRGLGAATVLTDRFIQWIISNHGLDGNNSIDLRWKVPASADFFVASLEKINFRISSYELDLKISGHQESEEDLDQ
jgi:ribosomal protein S18 acetylase RimI-like enzyme